METQVQALEQRAQVKASKPPVFAPALGKRNLLIAAALLVAGLLLLWMFETEFHLSQFGVSTNPYFVYQADSFLHGHWDLALSTKLTDVVLIHGKSYIVYPPMPAVVLMPFVAIWGLHTSDILFTAVCSALNLSLLYLVLEQARENGFTRRIWLENVCIGVLLWFGSISLWLSLGGRMWFTAHIVCMTFTLLALLAALRRHYALASLLLGCAFFSRATVIFGYLFLFYLAWQDAHPEPHIERFLASLWRRKPEWTAIPWRRLVPAFAVLVVVLALFMWRNTILFGSPLDSGYNVLIAQKYPEVTTGPFNISYVPANIVANFFSFPQTLFKGPFDRHPVLNVFNDGTAVSVFVTTPLFLFLFWRNRQFSATRTALWITLGLMVIAILLFHASGWFQFGARYLFDAYPFAFLLLALTDARVDWRFAALGYLGIGINILGAFQFWTLVTPHL